MANTLGYEEALAKAAALCSLSEKCESDIRKKFISWGLESKDCEKAILYLTKENYIDEKRFAKFFVQDKHKFSKWGKTKICYALREKGISPESIQESIAAINDDDYKNQLEDLLTAKMKGLKYKDVYDESKTFQVRNESGI